MKNKGQTTFISVLLLSIVLGVVLYMYYVSPTKQKTASLQASNATLTERVNTLEAFHREMPDKRKNIESMTAKINEDLASLPADVKEEAAAFDKEKDTEKQAESETNDLAEAPKCVENKDKGTAEGTAHQPKPPPLTGVS